MKSSIRSKLFLLVYGLILAFIAGLILLNNTFLEKYYIKNRESSLIDAFYEIKDIDINSSDFAYQIQTVEKDYNLNIQILKQVEDFDPGYVWSDFDNPPDVFARLYGFGFNVPNGIFAKIIYDVNQEQLGIESSYANKVDLVSSEGYNAYLMDIQSEFSLNNSNTQMLGLCVTKAQTNGFNLYYILTITFQSIEDNIKIFNSFTIIVGFFFMIISFITMFFISYSFTNPILQINKIAEEIANLDFSNKVDIKTDDEFGDLGASINRMSNQLEANIFELQRSNDKLAKEILYKNDVDNMRREFIASASHELKTPLSMIMGYTEALKLSGLDKNTKEEYISIILDETNKMNKLVKDLLKLSQIESGITEIEYKDFNVKDLIEDTINLFHLVFEENKIKLEVGIIDEIVNSDYDQLQTVMTNFISNAVNHLDDAKILKISAVKLQNGGVRVSVYNSGENIPESEIKHIWDSFYKIDKARTRSYGGQGLGLSICRTTLDLLGYDFGAKNYELGVEFYFEIFKI